MKRLLITLLLVLCLWGSAAAAHIPQSIQRTEADSRRVITKTFEVPPDTDPDTLQEPSFDEDGYAGALALDPSSVSVAASGYASKTSTLTDTQTFGGLDRNDPAYLPQSAVKNGVTLSLHDISWAVQETALAGSDLVPSKYIATATYRGSYSKD